MKKTILTMATALLFAATASADYVRTTSNGGPHGYNSTSKVISGQDTEIECTDPGFESCPTIAPPDDERGISAAVQEVATTIALDAIGSGELRGIHNVSIPGEGSFLVTWESRDREARTSNITIRRA